MNTAIESASRTDIYTRVTEKIIDDLERGVRTWDVQWSGEENIAIPRRHNGIPYRGINIIILWAEAIVRGYSSAKWMTYRQALELGGQVRKNARGTQVVYTSEMTKKEESDEGELAERRVRYLKTYYVFNTEDITNLPAEYYERPRELREKFELIKAAEEFFACSGAEFRHGGTRAFYDFEADYIQLPPAACFNGAESYASVKAHELVHWTGHKSRLAREMCAGDNPESYSREELVAELGAAFLCAVLGVSLEVREDHAGYLAHWLEILREDNRAVFKAAASAQRAVDYLCVLQANASP